MKEIYVVAISLASMAILLLAIFLFNQSPQAVTGKVINYYATTNGLSMLELNSGGSINADVVWNGNASIAANIIIGENCSVRTGWWQKLEMLDCSN